MPIQEWMKRWTDEELCAKNGITADAIAFIEKVIRPKDLNGDDSDE